MSLPQARRRDAGIATHVFRPKRHLGRGRRLSREAVPVVRPVGQNDGMGTRRRTTNSRRPRRPTNDRHSRPVKSCSLAISYRHPTGDAVHKGTCDKILANRRKADAARRHSRRLSVQKGTFDRIITPYSCRYVRFRRSGLTLGLLRIVFPPSLPAPHHSRSQPRRANCRIVTRRFGAPAPAAPSRRGRHPNG